MLAQNRPGPARVGIDFGTSSTVAVIALPDREPRPLLFDGSPLLPSAVCLDPTGRILTGRDALHTATTDPAAFEPYPKQRVDDGTVLLAGTDVTVTALFEAVVSRVLDEAANVTNRRTDTTPQVVITCPAGWHGTRRATLLSAAPPGTRLIDEPIAAAHYFTDIAGHDLPDAATAVVYDFGAGTFDTAVVRRTGEGFTTIAALGVSDCGGLDIDAAIVSHLAAAGLDPGQWRRLEVPTTNAERRARHQLWSNVRSAKEILSRTSATLIHVPLLDVEVALGREELDQLAQPILDRTVAAVREVLKTAGVDPAGVSAIFLSGGSSRMPAVVTSLHRAFGLVPTTVDQPELAVAEGSLRAAAATLAVEAPGTGVALPAAPGPPGHLPPAETPSPVGPAASIRRAITRRRIAVAAAVLGIAGLISAGLVAVSRDDGTAAVPTTHPSASNRSAVAASPSPSYPPGVDPCLLGSWRMTNNDVVGMIDDVKVIYSGGAGTIFTYRADRTSSLDHSKTQPRIARYQGDTFTNSFKGTAQFTYFAEKGILDETVTRNNVVEINRRNGTVVLNQPATFFPEPTQYRCTRDELFFNSAQGNFSTRAVRVVKPTSSAS